MLLLSGLLVLVIAFFYFTLRNTHQDVSTKQPYHTLLNQALITQRESTLAKNLPAFSIQENYFLTENKELFEGVEETAILPQGTKITFNKAIHYKNGTSGITHSMLIGTAWIEPLQKEMSFEYNWGELYRRTLQLLDISCRHFGKKTQKTKNTLSDELALV